MKNQKSLVAVSEVQKMAKAMRLAQNTIAKHGGLEAEKARLALQILMARWVTQLDDIVC